MVYILGGAQSDFARNWAREGVDLASGFSDVVLAGLEATGLEPKDVECGHVGNFVAELFAGQGLLGGFFGLVHPDFDGLPTARHEAACASGGVAILAAAAESEAGRYDLACVVGIELMRNVSGLVAAQNLGAAAYVGQEFEDATYLWPRAFSDLGEEYDRRYGLNTAHLAANDAANPVIEGMIRKLDCGQVTDGAAVIFLASPARAAEYAKKRGVALDSLPRIRGWGHRSAPISYARKIHDSEGRDYVFPQVRRAIEDARRRAGIADIAQLDAVETHDCFTTTEYMAIDHLGLTAPGEAWKAVEDGSIEMGGRLPINPSGGLIGLGHPVGATGVRMALDAFRQTTGTAGDYQVEGAKTVQTLNIGGSTTTTVSLVIGV